MDPKDLELIEKYLRESNYEGEELRRRMDAIKASTTEFNKELREAKDFLGKTSDAATSLASSLRDSINFLSKGNTDVKKVVGGFRALESVASKFKYDMMDYSTMSKKEIERNITKIYQNKNLLNNLKKQGDLTDQQREEIKDVIKQTDLLIEQAKERLAEEIKIQKKLGLTGAVIDGIVGSLNKLGISSVFFDDLKENLRDAAKSGGALKVAFTGVVGLARGLGQALADPLTLMTFFVTQGVKANEQMVDLGKSLGIGKYQAQGLREEFVKYSIATKDNFITTDKLLKSQTELTQQLGIAVIYSNEELETQSRLTEIVGLTAEEAAKLNKFSAATNLTSDKYVASLRRGAFAAMQTTKTHFSDKEILQDVSKLSAGILVKFQGNPEALAKAVVQAKALGLTLDQVDKIGESLLNFETSIENELKAELITGRQLNLEKARAAALTGDQATLMQEIANQAGSLEDFQKMNVIAQRSLAEAFGLSREEMSDMLLQQQLINKYGDKAKELNADQIKQFQEQKKLNKDLTLDQYLKQQAEQLNVQQKFNNAILKLQDLIGNLLAGPLGSLLDSLASGLDYITKIVSGFARVGSIIKDFFGDKIGGALGNLASAATIGALVYGIARLVSKGTAFNPMYTKEVGVGTGSGGGDTDILDTSGGGSSKSKGSKLKDLFKKGRAGKVARGRGLQQLGSKALKVGKGAGLLSLLSVGADLGMNLGDENRSVGNALLKTADQNKFTAGGAAIGGGIGALLGGVFGVGAGAVPGAAAGSLIGSGIGGLLDMLLGEKTQLVDDMVGYGARTLLTPHGAVALNNQDTVIAGTNLFKGDDVLSMPKGALNFNMSAVVESIDKLSKAIESRPIQITWKVDGKEMGTVLVQGSPKSI